MPFLSNLIGNDEACTQYLKDVYNSVVLKDIVKRNKIRDVELTLENIVFMELLRRGYSVTGGKANEKEIDFIAQNHNHKLYIQVSYMLINNETIEREFNVYNSIPDNYPKYVVSMDEFDLSRNGIKHFNIRDFLLKEEWN